MIKKLIFFLAVGVMPVLLFSQKENTVMTTSIKILIIDKDLLENMNLSEEYKRQHLFVKLLIEPNEEDLFCGPRVVCRARYSEVYEMKEGKTYTATVEKVPWDPSLKVTDSERECYSYLLKENEEWIYVIKEVKGI